MLRAPPIAEPCAYDINPQYQQQTEGFFLMYAIKNAKVFQTLPGQGWRLAIRWNASSGQSITTENVIAWVTAKITRSYADERVIIAPLVRNPNDGELVLVDTETTVGNHDEPIYGFALLAPAEDFTERHERALRRAEYPVERAK